MRILALDTENNTYNKGACFDRRFKNVCWSWADSDSSGAVKTDEGSLVELGKRIGQADLLVGFNFKYDLHVFRKLGVPFEDKRVWDCQVAEFIISGQKWKYPSLEESLVKYGLGNKIDVVATEYWSKGIQTEDIPWNILSEYAEQDAVMTLALYHKQMEVMTAAQIRLCKLQCLDLLILEEMEWHGIKFNEELCVQRSEEIKTEIQRITEQLSSIYSNVPINFSSGDHLSSFLYGGSITEETRVLDGFYKSGLKAGQPKFKKVLRVHELPRLVEPLRGSELKKEGFFATNQDTLLKLKANKKTKHILDLIQKQTRLETLLSKTYDGLIKKRIEQEWDPGWLHGQFNQVTTLTGRLSSSGPNLQNLDASANDLFVSRYEN